MGNFSFLPLHHLRLNKVPIHVYTQEQLQFTNSDAILLIDRIFRSIFDIYGENGTPEKTEDVIPFLIASRIAYSLKLVASDGNYRTKLKRSRFKGSN